jgi:stage II sporulation protein AB (anti-sigma F factor)
MQVNNHAKLEFQSLPANVAFARVTVAAFASQLDFTLNDLEEIKVAVSEAVANAIVHGYENRTDGTVFISMSIGDLALELKIWDYGVGIPDVKKAMQLTYSTDPERMGLGFVFMQSFMDSLHVDSTPGKGTTVTMVKSAVSKVTV